MWALLIAAPAVALWDALSPAPGFQWNTKGESNEANPEAVLAKPFRILAIAIALLGPVIAPAAAQAFCGFYVWQKRHLALQPRIAGRDGAQWGQDRAEPDEQLPGEPSEFALVVPVPEVLQREQIHIGDRELLSGWTPTDSPRLR